MRKLIDYINNHKAGWIEMDAKKQDRFNQSQHNKFVRKQELEAFKKTDDYKIQNLQKRERKLMTKEKRINTLLKKVRKQIKYYEGKKLNRKI